MVFQSYALYPHMTVRDNMAFALKIAKKSKEEIDTAINKAARILQLEPYLDRLPKALSGGQRQRVAIGRSIVRDPKVYLFDEPLSNLDAALRVATRIEIAQLKEAMPESTMIYVTHDQVEAMTLADRIVVLNGGVIEQVGTPRELFETPRNTFVATFIGSPRMTLVEATREGTGFAIPGSGTVDIPQAPAGGGATVTLGLRPDALEVRPEGEGYGADFVYSEYLGTEAYVYARLGCGTLVCARMDPNAPGIPTGGRIGLVPRTAQLHFFDNETGQRL